MTLKGYIRGEYMLEIKNDCTLIQKYIKKSKSTLEVFIQSIDQPID